MRVDNVYFDWKYILNICKILTAGSTTGFYMLKTVYLPLLYLSNVYFHCIVSNNFEFNQVFA